MVVPPGEVEASEPKPVADARRVRFVLIALVVLAIAAALIAWWLLR
jgi:multidrug resistance efflux pump